MTFKTITIRIEVYDKLKKIKKKNQSFSDVIEELIQSKKTIKDFLGAWELDDNEELEIRKQLTKSWNEWSKNVVNSE